MNLAPPDKNSVYTALARLHKRGVIKRYSRGIYTIDKHNALAILREILCRSVKMLEKARYFPETIRAEICEKVVSFIMRLISHIVTVSRA